MGVFSFALATLAFALGILEFVKFFLEDKEIVVEIVECVFGLHFQQVDVVLGRDRTRGHHAQKDFRNITVDVPVRVVCVVRVIFPGV